MGVEWEATLVTEMTKETLETEGKRQVSPCSGLGQPYREKNENLR